MEEVETAPVRKSNADGLDLEECTVGASVVDVFEGEENFELKLDIHDRLPADLASPPSLDPFSENCLPRMFFLDGDFAHG